MTRARTETRLVRGRSGTRRVVVERAAVAPIASLPEVPFKRGVLDPMGPIAADCENHLRGRTTFPTHFWGDAQ